MRQVAKHIYIGELLSGEYEEREGWEPNIVHTGRGDVSRVNIIGSFIEVNGQEILDDGTGQISLRAFEQVPGLKAENHNKIVQVIGRPRTYQESFFLIPEVIQPVAENWAAVRKAELGNQQQYNKPTPTPAISEEVKDILAETDAEKIIVVINQLDKNDGAQIEDVITQSNLGERAEKIIDQLLMDGEIFEIKPGVVKVL